MLHKWLKKVYKQNSYFYQVQNDESGIVEVYCLNLNYLIRVNTGKPKVREGK